VGFLGLWRTYTEDASWRKCEQEKEEEENGKDNVRMRVFFSFSDRPRKSRIKSNDMEQKY
jgi:hypothetical protein